jgi:hypothetical protein
MKNSKIFNLIFLFFLFCSKQQKEFSYLEEDCQGTIQLFDASPKDCVTKNEYLTCNKIRDQIRSGELLEMMAGDWYCDTNESCLSKCDQKGTCPAYVKGINDDESDFRIAGTRKISYTENRTFYKFLDNDKKKTILKDFEVENIVCKVDSLTYKSAPDEKVRIAYDLVVQLQLISKDKKYEANFYRNMDHPEVRHEMTVYEKQ